MNLRIVPSRLRRPLAPQTSEFSRRFWEALAEGRFITTRCDECDVTYFPPRPHCPQCQSATVSWRTLSGRGTLYSRTRIHAAAGAFGEIVPYAVGLVDLAEGIRLAAGLVDDAADLALDSPVQLIVVQYTDGPMFAVANAGG